MIKNINTIVLTFSDLDDEVDDINLVSIKNFSKYVRDDIKKAEVVIYIDPALNSKIIKNKFGNPQ